MKRTLYTVALALGLMMVLAPVASADVQNQRFDAAILFAEGGSFNEETGESTYVSAEAVRPLEADTELFFRGLTRLPLDCFDGASLITFFSGLGPTSFDLGPRYSTGAATATLDMTVETFDDCTEESTFDVVPDVTFSIDLAGEGPVLRERHFETNRTPSENGFHQQAHAVGRQAAGTLSAGDLTLDTFAGFIGETYGNFHARPPIEGLSSIALAAATLNEHEQIDFAEATWSSETENEYHDRFIGLFSDREGETFIRVSGVDDRYDPDQDCTVTTLVEGVGTGSLTLGTRYESAVGSGLVDLEVVVIDDCTGGETQHTVEDVPVSVELTADGGVYTEVHHKSLLVPTEYHGQQMTRESSRAGEGTFTIDGTLYEGVTTIGSARMSSHESV